MNFFNNIKMGTKILVGFFIILILMAVTGGIALFQITRINATVIELADHLAKDQHLSEQMVTRILLARFYANKYIRRQQSEDLKRFNEEFAHFEALLAEAEREIIKDERLKMLASIKTGLQDYGKHFAEVIRLMAKRRNILLEGLNVQGPLAEKKLEQLRKSAFQAKDTVASFYAADAQRALLLMRLDAFKYLEEGNTKWVKKFEERYQEAQVAFKKLDEELQEARHRQLAQEAQAAINRYYQGFMGLQTDYAQQNKIIETQLNIIGPQIRKTASNMSDSVTADFDESNQATHALVSYTWIELLIMMGLTILVGLGLGFAISRSLRVPLTTLTEMGNKMLAGDMKQIADIQTDNDISQITSRQDEMGEIGRTYDALARYFRTVIEDIVQISQGLAKGNLRVTPQAEYKGDFVQIKQALETALSNLRLVTEDIVQVSQGLAAGNLRVKPKAEYGGDFIQIKQALETATSDLSQVTEDIVQVSQGLAEAGKNVTAQAEYRGDFIQIKNALEMATAKLAEATAQNAIQNWLKTGQTQLNEQIRGEQAVMTLAKNIITFLTTYLEAQVGVFYLLEEEERANGNAQKGKEAMSDRVRLKLLASYAYTQRKGMTNEFQIGEGLIGQAALEKQRIIVNEVPEDYIHIQSGLGEAVPQNLIVIPFLYENTVKGVIEIGSFHAITEIQLEFLDQIMPNIGIAVNTADSRTKMQALICEQ